MKPWAPAAGALLLSSACGQSDAAAPPRPAPEQDAGDHNATFESAQPVEVGAPGVYEFVDGREDDDFFSFEGRSGEWLEIRSNYFDPITFSDTRITLFDPDRVQIAFNRYVKSLKGENVLARIVTRLPRDGKYFVLVNDPGGPPISLGLSQAYRLTITELSAEPDGFTVEPDAGDDPTPLRFHEWKIDPVVIDDSFVVGTFSDQADVDRFSFTVQDGEVQTLSAEVEESGTDADGATSSAGKVWVTTDTGTDVIARIDNAEGQTFLGPPLPSGNYVLSIAHPDSASGNNDFYVLRALLGPENPVEAAEATNGTIATAEPLALTVSGNQSAGYFLAHVLDQDVDYFRVEGTKGGFASVYCQSAEGGSGIVGLHVSVRDETDATLSEGTESSASAAAQGTTIALENVVFPDSGTLYVRVTKAGQLPDVVGDWARCAVYAQ